jgi:hypothetical protein
MKLTKIFEPITINKTEFKKPYGSLRDGNELL